MGCFHNKLGTVRYAYPLRYGGTRMIRQAPDRYAYLGKITFMGYSSAILHLLGYSNMARYATVRVPYPVRYGDTRMIRQAIGRYAYPGYYGPLDAAGV